MKKRLITILAVTSIVFAAIYGYSYVFKNKTVSENAPISKTTQNAPSNKPKSEAKTPMSVIAGTGSLRSAPGEHAEGTVHIYKTDGRYIIRFEDDTVIGASPDPIVTFGNQDKADLSINLGSLKGTKGSQNYDVPTSVDPTKYGQVFVYCRSLHVPIGIADVVYK